MPLREQHHSLLCSSRGACDCSEVVLQVPRKASQCSQCREQAMPLRSSSTNPSFGLPGGPTTAARWCSKCPEKPSSAVNVVVSSRRCLCGSSTTPHLGLPGEPATAARWCSKCPEKPSNAVDIKSRRCLCGSSTNPCFVLPGEPATAARRCSKCPEKPPNAVNVVSRRCLCGSSTNPSFGLPGIPGGLRLQRGGAPSALRSLRVQ